MSFFGGQKIPHCVDFISLSVAADDILARASLVRVHIADREKMYIDLALGLQSAVNFCTCLLMS